MPKIIEQHIHGNSHAIIKENLKCQERIQGGGGGGTPPKIEKNNIFWHKIVIFHTKYPKNFRASLRNWKIYDFLA